MATNILVAHTFKGATNTAQLYQWHSSTAPSIISGRMYMGSSDRFIHATTGARNETCVNVKYEAAGGVLPSGADHWLISYYQDNTNTLNTPLAGLKLTSGGALEVWEREVGFETMLDTTAAGVIAPDTVYTLEFLYYARTTAVGGYVVNVWDAAGTLVTTLSATGIVTSFSAGLGSWVLGPADTGTPYSMDDYFNDVVVSGKSITGAVDTTIMYGPTTFYQLRPNGVGLVTEHSKFGTPTDNWDCVDELPCDLDLTFLFAPTAGLTTDDYTMDTLPSSHPPIVSVTGMIDIKATTTSGWQVKQGLNIAGVGTQVGNTINVSAVDSTYHYVNQPPITAPTFAGVAWTDTILNSAQMEVTSQRTSGSATTGPRISQAYFEVCCAGVVVRRPRSWARIVG